MKDRWSLPEDVTSRSVYIFVKKRFNFVVSEKRYVARVRHRQQLPVAQQSTPGLK